MGNQMCDKNLRIHSNLCQFKVAKCEDPTLELLEDQSKCPIDVLPDWGTDSEDDNGDDDDDDVEEEGRPDVQPPDVQPPDIPTQKEVEEDNDAAKPSMESDDDADAAPTDEDTAAPVEVDVEVEATDG